MKTKSILALHKFLVSKTATYIYIFKKKKIPNSSLAITKRCILALDMNT